MWTVIAFLSPVSHARHAQRRIPQNSVFPDCALLPGGLSGKRLPRAVGVDYPDLIGAGCITFSKYDWYVYLHPFCFLDIETYVP